MQGFCEAILAAAIHPAFRVRLVAAGLDEIRGPAPDHRRELEARAPKWALPASVLTDLPSRLTIPSQLVDFSGFAGLFGSAQAVAR
jgi:hypothetical protein